MNVMLIEEFVDRYKSFCRSLNNLAKSRNANMNEDFVLEGTARIFILTFDLSWKVMKDILVKKLDVIDFATGSPRDTLKTAFGNNLIDDDIWLEMLKTRNLLAHDYDGIYAEKSFDSIITGYYDTFIKFRDDVLRFYSEDEKDNEF